MKKAVFFLIACFMTGLLFRIATGEHLVVIDSMTISPQNAGIIFDDIENIDVEGIYISDTIVYATTTLGIIARKQHETKWRMIVKRAKLAKNLGDNIDRAESENAIFRPKGIWKMSASGDLGVFDDWLRRFYAFDPAAPVGKRLQLLKRPDEESIIETINANDDIVLCGLYSIHHERMIGFLRPDLSGYRRIFDIPFRLRHDLDSMGGDISPSGAFNPADSTVWIVFRHYNKIYIVDMEGDIQDSVAIDHPDFPLPSPPASRIQSSAVHRDWFSKCASIHWLQYVPSGYFVLKFTGPGKWSPDDGNRQLHILFWTTRGEPVELEIQQQWEPLQVQPDGVIPFVTYERENGKTNAAIIYLTRVEP